MQFQKLFPVNQAEVKYCIEIIVFFQLAAAGHATGANSHTLFWNQAEDKFKQVEGDLKGLPGLTTAKDEVTDIKAVLGVQIV